MAKSKALKGRIRSVQNTRKITRTMELVSTSKLKRSQDRVVASRPYAEALREVIAGLVTPELSERFPLLRQPVAPKDGGPTRAAVILITSNRGLCGAFNSNLIKEANRLVGSLEALGHTVELHCIGRKGAGFFRYHGRSVTSERQDIGDRPTPEHAESIVAPLLRDFTNGTLGRVDLVFASFRSALVTPPTTQQVLPVTPPSRGGRLPDYLLRPDADTILQQLLPLYVRNAVYRGLIETVAGEHGARRTAMKNATDNAGDLIERLQRTYNRQRQAQITQEIAEIVGGAAALQG